jgi:bacterial SH3 domain protein
MKKALSVISVGFLSLTLLAACNGGESETQKELAALKEQLAQQQKQQAERENQEQEHRKQIEQQQREDELYQKAYQDAQEDLQMKQMLEEEKKQEEAKKKQAAEERKREEAKKKQALEEEPKQKEEARIKQEEPRIRQEESPKATAKPTASQQASKVTEKLVRYPAFVISESGSGSLNLRGGPSISAVSVTQLKDGQQLQVVAETNACTNANGGCWVKVQVGGLTGYVSNAYLQKGHVRDGAYAY